MNVVIRCDAGTHIGTGHLMRCLTLAQCFRKHDVRCHFICRDHPGSPHSLVEKQGFPLSVLPRPEPGFKAIECDVPAHAAWLGVSATQDAADTRSAMESISFSGGIDWLLVDHYGIDRRWHAAMRNSTQRIGVIDDLADRLLDADLLLDQNLGHRAADYDQVVSENCTRLIGLEYALLRDEFSQWRQRSLDRRAAGQLQHLTINLGGMDADNLSSRLLENLRQSGYLDRLEVDVILGPTAPHREALQRQVQKTNRDLMAATPDRNERVRLAIGVSNMAERLAQTDLVIGAAGSSSWERCCLGVPTLVLVIAANQSSLARELEEAGAAVALDIADLNHPEKLSQTLAGMSTKLVAMQNSASGLLDGRGTERVVAHMLSE